MSQNQQDKTNENRDINYLTNDVKDLLKEIKFISSCPANKKISFKLRRYIEPNSWTVDGFRKMLLFETHNTIMLHIETVIFDTSQYIKTCIDPNIINLFQKYLGEMKIGLNNLKDTYKEDADAHSSICVIIDQLDLVIKQVEELS